MIGSRIAGLGVALPNDELSNDDLAARFGIEPEWIESRTGIRSRRIAAAQENSATLGAAAAQAALADAGAAPSEVQQIICATVTPVYRFPATACLIQAALGCSAAALDLNAGCSGFLFALAQADAAIRGGLAERVLVVGSEIMSSIVDFDDRQTAILFGDGAGAVVVERSDHVTLGPFRLFSDGGRPQLLHATHEIQGIHMEGREVFRAAVEAMAGSVDRVLREARLTESNVDLLVAHQANQRILDAVAARIGLPEAVGFSNISRYGNTSAASIPIALFEARERGLLHIDDRVVLTAFGAGFTWGAALVQWSAPEARDAAKHALEAVDA